MQVIDEDGEDKEDFYYDSDGNDSYATVDSSDDCQDEVVRSPSKFNMYDPAILLPEFEVGLCFDGPEQFKKALSKYAAMTHRNIYCRHSDSKRIRVKCEDCCPFSLSASYDGKSGNLMVKSHIPKHRCNLKFDLKMVTAKYLADAIRDNIIKMTRMKLKDLHAHIEANMRLDVKKNLVKRTKSCF